MRKQNKRQSISLNGGSLEIEIDGQGNVIAEGERQLTARQLDGLAELSSLGERVKKLEASTVDETQTGNSIIHEGDGTLTIGCQTVIPSDIRRVHKASLAARAKRK